MITKPTITTTWTDEHAVRIQKYLREFGLGYIAGEEDGKTGFTQSCLVLSREYHEWLRIQLGTVHQFLYDRVSHLMDDPFRDTVLSGLGFSPVLVKAITKSWHAKKTLSVFGRYDLVLDSEYEAWVIECNSEVPAGLPELINDNIYGIGGGFPHGTESPNKHAYETIIQGLRPLRPDGFQLGETVLVLYYPDTEDELNAKTMATLLHASWNISVKAVSVTEVDITEEGVFYHGHAVRYVWSFYPLEWIEKDGIGGNLFWEHYLSDKIEIINQPSSLLLQNKKFMAYIGNIPHVPHTISYEKEGYIKKPILEREGVGVDVEEYDGDCIWQKRIAQPTFTMGLFNGEKCDMYLTLGMYVIQDEITNHMYNRASSLAITDAHAFHVPTSVSK